MEITTRKERIIYTSKAMDRTMCGSVDKNIDEDNRR
jgi:hypothetical protein